MAINFTELAFADGGDGDTIHVVCVDGTTVSVKAGISIVTDGVYVETITGDPSFGAGLIFVPWANVKHIFQNS